MSVMDSALSGVVWGLSRTNPSPEASQPAARVGGNCKFPVALALTIPTFAQAFSLSTRIV